MSDLVLKEVLRILLLPAQHRNAMATVAQEYGLTPAFLNSDVLHELARRNYIEHVYVDRAEPGTFTATQSDGRTAAVRVTFEGRAFAARSGT